MVGCVLLFSGGLVWLCFLFCVCWVLGVWWVVAFCSLGLLRFIAVGVDLLHLLV